jgi:type-F conjugative transfer system pilin assembly protein TrbC
MSSRKAMIIAVLVLITSTPALAGKKLYVFISFSMPESMIHDYLREAKRFPQYDPVAVIRGIPENENLESFIFNKLRHFVATDKTVPIQLDPRLFDAYGINAAPTLILADEPYTCLQNPCQLAENYTEMKGGVSLLHFLTQSGESL